MRGERFERGVREGGKDGGGMRAQYMRDRREIWTGSTILLCTLFCGGSSKTEHTPFPPTESFCHKDTIRHEYSLLALRMKKLSKTVNFSNVVFEFINRFLLVERRTFE